MGLFSSNKNDSPGKRERDLAEDQRRRDAERDFYNKGKAIDDAHAAGRHCGRDCNVCRRAGRTF